MAVLYVGQQQLNNSDSPEKKKKATPGRRSHVQHVAGMREALSHAGVEPDTLLIPSFSPPVYCGWAPPPHLDPQAQQSRRSPLDDARFSEAKPNILRDH